jgi:hypothetical protein
MEWKEKIPLGRQDLQDYFIVLSYKVLMSVSKIEKLCHTFKRGKQ